MEAGIRGAGADRPAGGGTAALRLGPWARLVRPTVLFGIALAASGVLLLVWQSQLTFLIDDWNLLIHRRGGGANDLLDPHAGHIIIAPAALYKGIQATLGMDSLLPYAVPATAFFLASVAVLFVYLRRRVGGWLALAGTLPVLFMGSAYEDLLTPFQIGFFAPMALGIGALLALERRDPRGDALACGLLIGALLFSEIALPFLAGAAVAIALDRGPLSRAYVVAGPALLYAAWYLGWQEGTDDVTFQNIARSPRYMLDGMATSVGGLLGFGQVQDLGENALSWGRPLLVGLVAAGALWLHARSGNRAWLLVSVAVLLTFWFITAANANPFRLPTASRYQYVSAVLLLMVAADCFAGIRPGWRGTLAILGIAAAATASNLSTLREAYRTLHGATHIVRGGLSGLELAAPRVDPEFRLTPENSNFNYFTLLEAGPYLSAADEFGSPAYGPDQLPDAPEPSREAADKVLAAALGVALEGTSGAPSPSGPPPRQLEPADPAAAPRGSCLRVRGGGRAALVALPPGGATLRTRPGTHAELRLRRFASSFPVELGRLRGVARLEIPPDESAQPWELELTATGPVTICGSGTGTGAADSA